MKKIIIEIDVEGDMNPISFSPTLISPDGNGVYHLGKGNWIMFRCVDGLIVEACKENDGVRDKLITEKHIKSEEPYH